jgi:DNA-binding response OmpR family regulator
MPSVLVVDDDIEHREFLRRCLSSAAVDVDLAVDGADALFRFGSAAYDVVLLDLRLPDINGKTVLRKMIALKPQLPVVVVSAADDRANRVQCFELGAADFVAKPFDVAELVARVRGRIKSADRRFLRVGSVTLDLSRHSVTTSNGTAQLTPREFGLLHHLMSSAGEVCSRDEMVSRVWGVKTGDCAGVVEVYIWRLRHKLPADLIETVRNVGYSFAVAR